MNRYMLYVTGNDSLGYNFMKNVVEASNKGAILQEDKVPRLSYPQSCWMYIESKDMLEDSPGFRYQVIQENYTKEQLEDMPIEDIRPILARRGIKGRDKSKMIKQYLATYISSDTCDGGEKVSEEAE